MFGLSIRPQSGITAYLQFTFCSRMALLLFCLSFLYSKRIGIDSLKSTYQREFLEFLDFIARYHDMD